MLTMTLLIMLVLLNKYMKEFDNLNFSISNNGNSFYLKWKKDTIISAFVIAPAMFIFYLLCTTLIVGVSVKLFFILLIPMALIILGLVYSPYFLRGKYINNTVKSVSINNDIISIETYKWFTNSGICISAKIAHVKFSESSDVPFFKGRKVFLLNSPDFGASDFYIVDEFFDNVNGSLQSLIGNNSKIM